MSHRAWRRSDNLMRDVDAAALTYYSLLSLFPALLFGAALLGVFGQQALINQAANYLVTRERRRTR